MNLFLRENHKHVSKHVNLNNAFVLRPEQSIRFLWEMFMMGSLIILGIITPYSLAFLQDTSSTSESIDYFATAVFSIDILVTLNTGVYVQGKIDMNRTTILKKYVRFWLWLDLISTLPLQQILSTAYNSNQLNAGVTLGKSFNILKVLKLLKLVRITKLKFLIRHIEDHISSKKLLSLFKILKLALYLFLVANFFACLMFMVSNDTLAPSSFVSELEMSPNGYIHSSGELYVYSLYWALTTMVSVGYGDYTPSNTPERLLGIVTMNITSIIFGYIIGNVGTIIEKHTVKNKERREHMVNMNKFMKVNTVSDELQRKIRKYIDYIYSNSKSRVNLGDLLTVLSQPLREEIYSHINGKIVLSLQFFQDLSRNSISRISKILKPQVHSPKDMIFIENEQSLCMYFITKGCVDIIDYRSKSCIKILSSSSFFGEIGLFTGEKRCASVQTVTFVETLCLTYADLSLVSKQFPEISLKISRLKDSCSEGDLTSLEVKCYLCLCIGHIAKRCKKMTERENIQRKWLNSRRESQVINADHYSFTRKYIRAAKNLKITELKLRNVFGVKRGLNNLYPRKRRFVRCVKEYLMNLPRKSDEESVLSDTFSMASQESDISVYNSYNPKNYKIILDVSSDEALIGEKSPRSIGFDTSLVDHLY